ncbi:hypothetical protein [Nocardioides dongkuii]|uniref:hypothetical protein n=1 Tax=Nocardioides dongkuii TaxID=2760089 RepID=UPI0015F917E7|nr:hypothetical protein [Nocardioides dongkuii]
MNDLDPFDGPAPHLSERMERAVGGLRAPDVAARAMARGRRQRTRRRLSYAAGGIAAATALVLAVPTFATDGPERGQDPSGPTMAADPAATSSTSASPTTAPPGTGGAAVDECGATGTGWWSKPTTQIQADLSALLPEGTRIGDSEEPVTGMWEGNLVAGDDADFASLTLLPPPGVLGPVRTLEEVSRLGRCGGGANEPMQAVKPCEELTNHLACEEIRSDDGTLVGVVTEHAEETIVDGREQPTDRTYFMAVAAGPDGGHVELYVAEGTRADRPLTVHDPADEPALTLDQVREIVADPVWIS